MHLARKNKFKSVLFVTSFAFVMHLFVVKSYAKDIEISANPITSFLPSKPDQKIFGKLKFLGGVELTSDNEDFGGLSGIEFRKNQKNFIAITDKARFITGEIVRENNSVSKIENATLTRTRNSKGKTITGADDKDSEAITFYNGQIVLGYERNDRIAFFKEENRKLIQSKTNPAINLNSLEFPFNKGIEAITIEPLSKTIYAFSEHALNKDGNHRGFIIKDANIEEFTIAVPGGYSITDAAFLPSGELILLERYYSIFTGANMRIRRFAKGEAITSKTTENGETLIEANSQFEIDNMEGLSITKMHDGSIRLTLVSDNNFSKNQRTLLLEFQLEQ